MGRYLRQPYLGHAAILAVLIASIGAVRTAYVDPRAREAATLRTEANRLEGEMADLQRGVQDLERWKAAHPGQRTDAFASRRALPARAMVATFLREVAPIADEAGVRTELIQPAGGLADVTVSDDAGRTTTYRKAELGFRITAPYRALGAYLARVEAMDQLVVVRSVTVAFDARTYPDLTADVTIWLYGTP
ncbi:MAG: type 4a pilus biogenesis protein PilO [Hyphomicrobiales bacterium]